MTDITALINSENKGDRIKALNTIRELEPAIAFGYINQLQAQYMVSCDARNLIHFAPWDNSDFVR